MLDAEPPPDTAQHPHDRQGKQGCHTRDGRRSDEHGGEADLRLLVASHAWPRFNWLNRSPARLGRYAVRVARTEIIPDRPGAETDLTDRGAIKDPLL